MSDEEQRRTDESRGACKVTCAAVKLPFSREHAYWKSVGWSGGKASIESQGEDEDKQPEKWPPGMDRQREWIFGAVFVVCPEGSAL